SEEILMIESDIGNHADLGADDICRIETTSHAGFRDDQIGLLFCEVKEGHRGYHLKKGGVSAAIEGCPDFFKNPQYPFCRDFLVIYAEAFRKAHQVWRSIEADLDSMVAENSGKNSRSGALAVGPGDMNE